MRALNTFFTLLLLFLFFASISQINGQATQHVKVIHSVQAAENFDNTITTIVVDEPLTYVTRQSGFRYQLIIPRAGASVVEGKIHDGKFVYIRAERKEYDAVFSFELLYESTVTIKKQANILNVIITPNRLNNTNSDKSDIVDSPVLNNKESSKKNNGATQNPQVRSGKVEIATSTPTEKISDNAKSINNENIVSQINNTRVSQSGLRINRTKRPPTIDDLITKTANRLGTEVSDFRQLSPEDGAPVTKTTKSYLSFDDSNLYVAFICKEEAGKVRAHMAKREDILNDDSVSVTLDTFQDKRRAYVFTVNPLGVQLDSINTEGQGDDYTFDTVWYSEGRVTADGFVALMVIPFKSLRFDNTEVQSWGVVLGRTIAHKNEVAYYPYITQRRQGFIQQAATLDGIEKISAGRNIQITPYYVASREQSLDISPDRPLGFRTQNNVRAGLDAKIVLKDAFTLDLTVNPDFSQVESDEPQVIINRRFETFFPEKRPFFIENAGFFQTPENLFFSRRIADPQFGARLTGKVGKWAIGGLLIDDKAPGRYFSEDESEYGQRAIIGVFRGQREFGEQSSVGVLFTNYDFASSYNRVFAVDSIIRLNQNWSFTGQAARSYTKELLGNAVSGSAYIASLSRSGRKLNYDLTYTDRSPNFSSNLGFIPRVDVRQIEQNFSYRWRPNRNGIVSFGPSAFTSANWDRKGRLQDWYVYGSFSVDFTGLTGIAVNRSKSYEFFSEQGFETDNTSVSFYTDRLDWLGVFASYNWGTSINYTPPVNLNPFVGSSSGGSLQLTIRPSTQLSFQQSYIYSRLGRRANESFLPNTKPESIYYNHIFRSKLNYQFNRELSLRAIVDYNAVLPNETLIDLERDKRFTTDFLLTYMLNPGTAVYVGYTDSYENLLIVPDGVSSTFLRTRSPFNPAGRRFFIKFSNLFQF